MEFLLHISIQNVFIFMLKMWFHMLTGLLHMGKQHVPKSYILPQNLYCFLMKQALKHFCEISNLVTMYNLIIRYNTQILLLIIVFNI